MKSIQTKMDNPNWKSIYITRFIFLKEVRELLSNMSSIQKRKDFQKKLLDLSSEKLDDVWECLVLESENFDLRKDFHISYYSKKMLHLLNSIQCTKKWKELLEKPESEQNLEDGAILIAKWEYPLLNIEDLNMQINALAKEIQERISSQDIKGIELVKFIMKFLFEEKAFSPNRENYYDPLNRFALAHSLLSL